MARWTPSLSSPTSMLLWLHLLLCVFSSSAPVALCASRSQFLESNAAIQRFREYLRIPTVHPDPDYAPAVAFLRRQADEIGLQATTVEFVQGKPVIVITWQGSEPSLSSILLSSHMDVVPVDLTKWNHDPFAADMDEEGNIFARGSQDMKGMGMHYLEAMRNLKARDFKPVRSIHVVFVPDEEIGGVDGWGSFVESKEFVALNVGIALDEGPISTDNFSYPITWSEKAPWWLVIKAVGETGHGSVIYDGSAMENLFKSIESISRFREAQWNLIKAGTDRGEVVTVNAVYLKSGTQSNNGYTMNIQPGEAEAGFDIRVPPYEDVSAALERRIEEEWAPASRNLTFWYEQKFETEGGHPVYTEYGDSNPWWVFVDKSTKKFGGQLLPQICGASTDMRFLRAKGIPAFGFTTLQNTPMLIHDNNEFVNAWAWLHGIPVFEDILEAYSSFSDIVNMGVSKGLQKRAGI